MAKSGKIGSVASYQFKDPVMHPSLRKVADRVVAEEALKKLKELKKKASAPVKQMGKRTISDEVVADIRYLSEVERKVIKEIAEIHKDVSVNYMQRIIAGEVRPFLKPKSMKVLNEDF